MNKAALSLLAAVLVAAGAQASPAVWHVSPEGDDAGAGTRERPFATLRKALEMAGVDASQAVHIGDSIVSDVEAAKAVSITPILLDRKGGRTGEDVTVIRSLTELVQE